MIAHSFRIGCDTLHILIDFLGMVLAKTMRDFGECCDILSLKALALRFHSEPFALPLGYNAGSCKTLLYFAVHVTIDCV